MPAMLLDLFPLSQESILALLITPSYIYVYNVDIKEEIS